ncbi:hypothetical protein [Erwinia amylovora]
MNKLLSLSFLILSLQASCNAYANNKYSPQTNLKNYALSSCISQGYQSKEVKEDAAAAARGYLESVSYTHLDVYKRQVQRKPAILLFLPCLLYTSRCV